MKKIITITLKAIIFIMLFTLTSCSQENSVKKSLIGKWSMKEPATFETQPLSLGVPIPVTYTQFDIEFTEQKAYIKTSVIYVKGSKVSDEKSKDYVIDGNRIVVGGPVVGFILTKLSENSLQIVELPLIGSPLEFKFIIYKQ